MNIDWEEKMKEKILTVNTAEVLKVKWDGERFSITREAKYLPLSINTIVLNPKEMLDLGKFAVESGGL